MGIYLTVRLKLSVLEGESLDSMLLVEVKACMFMDICYDMRCTRYNAVTSAIHSRQPPKYVICRWICKTDSVTVIIKWPWMW